MLVDNVLFINFRKYLGAFNWHKLNFTSAVFSYLALQMTVMKNVKENITEKRLGGSDGPLLLSRMKTILVLDPVVQINMLVLKNIYNREIQMRGSSVKGVRRYSNKVSAPQEIELKRKTWICIS